MSELPENWQDCELGDLAQTIKNGFVSQQNRDGVGFPITRIETIANGTIDENRLGFVSGITLESIQDYALIENDILFSHINSPSHLGKTALYRGRPNPLYHGMNLLLIRADEAVVNPRYLEYGLKFLRSQGVFSLNAQHAVNQASINQKKLKAMRLPLAPLAEQKRIADKLDALLARVDRCRARLDRVPLILKRFRQAVLAAATSGQLTEDWREARSNLGAWQQIYFKELICDGPQNGLYKHISTYGSGTRILRIDMFYDGEVRSWDEMKRLSVSKEEIEAFGLAIGDIVINRVNSPPFVGKSALIRELPEPCVFESNMMRIRVDQKQILPDYCIRFLNAPQGLTQLRKNVKHAVNQSSINQQDIKSVIVNLPPLEEQHEIVRRVEILFAYADRLAARYQAARAQVERLTPALLAKAFRGELVPQDPADEPAGVLLARVRAARG